RGACSRSVAPGSARISCWTNACRWAAVSAEAAPMPPPPWSASTTCGRPIWARTGWAAWAEGVGEQLTPVEVDEPWYLVVVPPCHVSTAEIFSDERLTRDTTPITLAAFREHGGRNDCLPVVTARYPEIRNTLILLNK